MDYEIAVDRRGHDSPYQPLSGGIMNDYDQPEPKAWREETA